jgi:RimJ/RimL family protein N-acetyltransferase
MNLTYRDIDYDSVEDCEHLAKWYNDPTTKHLYSLFTNEESHAHQFTPETFQKIGQTPRKGGPYRDLMVLLDGQPIGEAKFETDTPKLLTKTPNTAWIALIIGDHRYRRSGLGTRITKHLEQLVKESGAERIEIGVFEYNHPSLNFFKKMGYQEFMRQPDRIWWDGKRWDDVRLRKELEYPSV